MENVLPRKIRCLRKQAGLTQEDIAKRLDIRRQTYCNYENGSRSLPIETIVLLSDYFHVSVDYLVREGVPLSPPPSPGNDQESLFLTSFRALSEQGQKQVLQFIQFQLQLSSFPG